MAAAVAMICVFTNILYLTGFIAQQTPACKHYKCPNIFLNGFLVLLLNFGLPLLFMGVLFAIYRHGMNRNDREEAIVSGIYMICYFAGVGPCCVIMALDLNILWFLITIIPFVLMPPCIDLALIALGVREHDYRAPLMALKLLLILVVFAAGLATASSICMVIAPHAPACSDYNMSDDGDSLCDGSFLSGSVLALILVLFPAMCVGVYSAIYNICLTTSSQHVLIALEFGFCGILVSLTLSLCFAYGKFFLSFTALAPFLLGPLVIDYFLMKVGIRHETATTITEQVAL
ncbi:MAG: hypothetical protein P4L69_13435 [Desulfosporosinus sp.]|nr:hypothetical protein [Desulfosporosinus sp.]